MRNQDLLNEIPAHSETGKPLPDPNGWQRRHFAAITDFSLSTLLGSGNSVRNHEKALVMMLQGWLAYADAHNNLCDGESKIGDDGVLGPEWTEIGKALRGLLNGELGRLDGGTLDQLLLNAMSSNNVDTGTF